MTIKPQSIQAYGMRSNSAHMSDRIDCGSVLQFSVLPLTSIVFSQLILPISVFFIFSIKSMADPQLSSYIPATISKLAYTLNRRLDNPVSARALL